MSRQSLEYVRRTIDLVQAQYRSGAVSGLELREARQALAEQQALLSQYTQARAELRQALAELLQGAEPPGGAPAPVPAETEACAAATRGGRGERGERTAGRGWAGCQLSPCISDCSSARPRGQSPKPDSTLMCPAFCSRTNSLPQARA